MRKVFVLKTASGWTLTLAQDMDAPEVNPTSILRCVDDLHRTPKSPLFGQDFAVFLPRERIVEFQTFLAPDEE